LSFADPETLCHPEVAAATEGSAVAFGDIRFQKKHSFRIAGNTPAIESKISP
jgi:hypothetical protein